MDLWEIERSCFERGFENVCGVDEAGRGPLAGPVFAAAVILPPGLVIEGLNDSKKLTAKKRDELFNVIIKEARDYSISSVDNKIIDEINILNATYLAMNRAIGGLTIKPDISLIDGNRNRGIEWFSECVVGGDGKSASIAAASILAKVSRDRFMEEIAKKLPQYCFEKHKGYGTKQHRQLICEHGVSEIHRLSFKLTGTY